MNLLPVAALGIGGPALIVMIILGFVIGLPLWIAPALLSYFLLGRIPREHRKQDQGLAFLLLIPLFSLIWAFFVYPKISESLQSYFISVGRTDIGDCGKSLALAACICSLGAFIPFLGMFAGLAALVLFIVFFIKAFDLSARIPKAITA